MNKMQLIIALRKEVVDENQAQIPYDIVKQRLEDHPEVEISGSVSSTLPLED